MPHRALIERRPLLVASLLAAAAFAWLQDSAFPGLYLLLLALLPYLLLAAYSLLRHRGNDTRVLAIMVALQGTGWAIAPLWPAVAMPALWLAFLAGLSLFLSHRTVAPDVDRKVAAVSLLLGTPVLCLAAAGSGLLFFGLALGAMAAAAWVSTFPRSRVGVGAVVIVIGTLMGMIGTHGIAAEVIALTAWPLAYLGALVLATGVTGELRGRAVFEDGGQD